MNPTPTPSELLVCAQAGLCAAGSMADPSMYLVTASRAIADEDLTLDVAGTDMYPQFWLGVNLSWIDPCLYGCLTKPNNFGSPKVLSA